MKNLALITFFLAAFHIAAFSQDETGPVREQLKAKRIAVYSEVLKLTPDEAAQFWPIFNEYADKREDVRQQLKITQHDNLSDTQAEENIRKYFELQQRELDLERDLVQKLRKVITVQKIAKLPEAERRFRKAVLEQVRDIRQDRMEQRKARRPGGRR